ncbi:MAG TPA: CDP-glucose 4,6-dehydratase [Cyanobacteria bacterium UBA11149]|nr:CDP-glucose 4,6-dehydratase [Cyanobacteria bacterium UBA11367]HBE58459.1 CDP-glucose 4,6-dehydratase [Cyanobacteria bacterium UBA11366]HBK62752.1 CDP-glucose 4,6-dehydratase [Cyanobacteria bacterium UBA11166]HBR73486.1 CDP-glucose 4,6-dehydratase [Cyanobacteria bacterium UBA11159]HBS71819.1 CDP-glucose 4,6-dehydratase [Cyanobacteria bacterium UBA11153]HBW92025.1 CDP-glucose 4,6-dehydratase [Cyanobacteria bacterium UBA11149]HCA94253.1 CDP-glucose 4,6-dehydratase [Cyanobacteria bacterium UBA
MDYNFWHGKKVLITGHTGFKGSWLSIWLQSLGAKTIGYALPPPTEPSLFKLANVAEGMVSIVGDVRDLANLKEIMAQHQPEIVFHMAAQPLVHYSYHHPVETYTTNIIGTVNVLEAVRHTPSVRTVVSITSDKCYQNKEWVWGYRENETLGGKDPYSSSKACAEIVISAYRDSYFSPPDYHRHQVALASVRAGNVIGGGDWAANRLIPDIIQSFTIGQSVLIRNPHATRPWQHVLQPLSGYLSVAEYLWKYGVKYAEAWNFGPNEDDAKPVAWIVEELTKLWGNGASWELDKGQHPHEDTYLKLDCSKAKSQLGWQPTLSLVETLEWIVEFYQGYLNKENIRELVEDQIKRYQRLEEKLIASHSLIAQPTAFSVK